MVLSDCPGTHGDLPEALLPAVTSVSTLAWITHALHLTASTEKVCYLCHPYIVGYMRLACRCGAPVDANVLAFLETGIQPISPKDLLEHTSTPCSLQKHCLQTCKFLVMKSFFCSGVKVAGSIEKDAFPFKRISEPATAIKKAR